MNSAKIHSFSYESTPHARLLILGSIPGQRSLEAVEYYAHPRNAFWPIMGALLGFDSTMAYPDRLAALKQARVALWDTVHSCERSGSLDQNISKDSVAANDFAHFFRAHPKVKAIAFNGGAAFKLFQRHVIKAGTLLPEGLELISLPSTSPAHAALKPAQKQTIWQEALQEWLK